MSVRKNLLFGRHFANRKNALSFDEVVLFLELEPLLNKSPSKLSGGESQRVALGRALLCAENFMILDEPLSSLDWEAARRLLEKWGVEWCCALLPSLPLRDFV
jgi:molybdate transport system ATP-binding protein